MRGKNRSLDGRGGRPCFVEKVEPIPHTPSSLPIARVDPSGGKAGRGKEGGKGGFVDDLNARSSDRATFEEEGKGGGMEHSLEGAGNLLRCCRTITPQRI